MEAKEAAHLDREKGGENAMWGTVGRARTQRKI